MSQQSDRGILLPLKGDKGVVGTNLTHNGSGIHNAEKRIEILGKLKAINGSKMSKTVLSIGEDDISAGVFGITSEKIDSLIALVRGRASRLIPRKFRDRVRGVSVDRYRIVSDDDTLFLGSMWSKSLTLWRSLVPDYVREILNEYLNNGDYEDDSQLFKYLKALTELVKKFADYVNWVSEGDWQFLVHIELFGGYVNSADEDELADDLYTWVVEDVKHDALTQSFDSLFSSVLAGWFKPTKPSSKIPPFGEWLSLRWTWARTGASTNKPNEKLAKTKWNLAWTFSDSELVTILLNIHNPEDLVHQLIIKKELGKARGVVGVDDAMYLIMSYLSEFVEDDLAHTPMFNYMSFENQLKAMKDMVSRKVKIPLDESKFDHNKSANQILSCVDAIYRFAKSRNTNGDHTELTLCHAFVRKYIYGGEVKVGRHKFSILKGILSGWKWTYLLDTMISVTQIKMCLVELNRQGYKIDCNYVCSGDDTAMSFGNLTSATLFVYLYTTYGYEINPAKFWISDTRNEFLRLTVTERGSRGYMPRLIPKILVGSPNSDDFQPKIERIRSLPSVWSRVAIRGGSRIPVLNHMYKDLSGLMSSSIQTAKQWAHTPIPYGGGGCWPPVVAGITLVEDDSKGDTENISTKGLRGVMDLSDYVAKASMATKSQIDTVATIIHTLFTGTARIKKKAVMSSEFMLKSVWIPPPTDLPELRFRSKMPQFVPLKWAPISSEILKAHFMGLDVPSSMIDVPALQRFSSTRPRWTRAALESFVTGKFSSPTVFMHGREMVRTKNASIELETLISRQKRLTIELIRLLAFSIASSSLKKYYQDQEFLE